MKTRQAVIQALGADRVAAIRAAVAAGAALSSWVQPDDPTSPPANTLWFYAQDAPFGCFSNFYRKPVSIDGLVFATTEHYFQAMKFRHDHRHFCAVRDAKSPMEAAKMGRERSRPLRPDWGSVRDDILCDAVLTNFLQHHDLRAELLQTAPLVIVEHTGNDSYWGDGGDGSGKNKLGIALMQVREVLRQIRQHDTAGSQISDIRAAVFRQVTGAEWVAAGGGRPANTIWFYGQEDNVYGCFSNFSAHPVRIDGRTFPTTEHYFQAMKFVQSKADFEAVAAAPSPGKAAQWGRDRSRPLRKDWAAVKDDIMFNAVLAKFEQHSVIRRVLLDTTDTSILVEHTSNDSYWGDGGGGTGRNMLGITLMQVRAVLRARQDRRPRSSDPHDEAADDEKSAA
jgi:ribA/ribD-fused uncharacterized protein